MINQSDALPLSEINVMSSFKISPQRFVSLSFVPFTCLQLKSYFNNEAFKLNLSYIKSISFQCLLELMSLATGHLTRFS